MKKLSFILFLSASLSCFAQVVVSSGTATMGSQTDMQSVAPGPPQIVPSNVALPGSGPPVGAPLTNSNTNDARTGGNVQAYNPATVYEHPVENPTGSESLPAAGVAAGIPFNMGLQSFSGSASTGQTSAPSLGDLARQYRKENHLSARMFTNDSITQMGPGQPVPQGKETAQAGPRDVQQEMARAAAIPPMSTGSMQANASSSTQSNGIDQTKRTPSSDANQTAAANPAPADNGQQAENEESGNRSNLPASGSELPLLALLGIAIAGGGALYRFRR
jgi:LPXTG-motif cell wall-anchored protein